MNDTISTTPNRMVKRKHRTRKKLMDAAIELVLDKGYEDVMTDEITELADVGRRTFYNHFDNKRDCVQAAVKERYTAYAEEKLAASEPGGSSEVKSDPALVITTMATHMFQLIASDPITKRLMLYPRILNEAVEESQRDFIVANVANGMMEGRFNPPLPTDSLGPILSWGFVGLVMDSITRGTQHVDSLTWGRFLLQNLGIEEAEREQLLESVAK